MLLLSICDAEGATNSSNFRQEIGSDVTYSGGTGAGSISTPRNGTTSAQTFAFEGIPMNFAFNIESHSSFSTFHQGGILYDLANGMVIRTGIGTGACYHVMGGSRRAIFQSSDVYNLLSYNNFNLSMCAKALFLRYSAANKDNLDERVEGSVVEPQAGIQYRHDIGESFSVGLEFYSTIISLPASVDRITTDSTEMFFFLRTYLN
jgi:hypothetical protein